MKLLSRPRASAADCVRLAVIEQGVEDVRSHLKFVRLQVELARVRAYHDAVSRRGLNVEVRALHEDRPARVAPSQAPAVANRRHGLVEAMLDALDEAGVS